MSDGWNGAPRRTQYRALHQRVLAVATTRVDGWCVYIADVEGWIHDNEWQQVLCTGDKCSETVARALFPSFAEDGCPYAD